MATARIEQSGNVKAAKSLGLRSDHLTYFGKNIAGNLLFIYRFPNKYSVNVVPIDEKTKTFDFGGYGNSSVPTVYLKLSLSEVNTKLEKIAARPIAVPASESRSHIGGVTMEELLGNDYGPLGIEAY